jgi:hypothetical protein
MRSTRGLTRLWPRLARKYENSWCVRVKQRRQPDEAHKENGSLQGATRFLRCIRVAAAAPGRGRWTGAKRAVPAAVVDTAPAVDLSRGSPHVERPTAGASARGDVLVRVWTGEIAAGRVGDPQFYLEFHELRRVIALQPSARTSVGNQLA